MSKKMLIDASHPEETRVVIVDGTRVEELDYESENKRQLRGNVYLARVTRVEPSLQAAFVEYGGNRHGFLAFSEIHADYYQIPHEDRAALLEAEKAESLKEQEEEESKITKSKSKDKDTDGASKDDDTSESVSEDTSEDDEGNDDDDVQDASEEEVQDEQKKMHGARRKRQSKRRYKIQEVIKRGQILLIQAVKEERGNKGAAMTTYLSLAGRYCVLMPNTPRGGGISRKISNGSDRKRLKAVMSELSVPQGMGVIVRTAGAKRTKVEIKRDYDYLSRLWDTIRDTTLKSIAPALIHEEGNLVKRSIRDLYGKDIDKILVQGDEAYRMAKDFIKMLMPSHAKNVQPYKDDIPLFLRYQVEQQIEACLEPIAQLKSGGYLVIHPTEALVSVDVNSGRSTKERNVERTALKTNLETADELARQMRLRDLAGLIVVDFIDMDERRNNRAVEKRMNDALKRDRARVQMSKISQFGLMEISRQRRRRSLLEGSTASCEHCHGVGRKRSVESSALRAVRVVEEEAIRGRVKRIRLKVTPDVAQYLLNEKRELLNQIEASTQMFTEIVADPTFIRPHFEIENLVMASGKAVDPLEEITKENRKANQQRKHRDNKKGKTEKDQESENAPSEENEDDNNDANKSSKRKRRRGRRGGRGRREHATSNVDTSTQETKTPNATDEDNNAHTGKTKDKDKAVAAKNDTPKSVDKDKKSVPKKAKRTRKSTKATSEKETPKIDDKPTEAKAPKKKRAVAKKTATKKPTVKKQDTVEKKEKPKKVTKKATAVKKTNEAAPKPKPKKSTTKKNPVTKKETTKKEAAKEKPEESSGSKKQGWWQKRNPFG